MDVIYEIYPAECSPLRDMSRMTNEKACEDYGWLVLHIAKQSMAPGVELDDLVQDGYLGLFRAVTEWDEARGASFKSLADLRIRNAIRDGLTAAGSDDAISLDSSTYGSSEDLLVLHEMIGTPPEQEELVARVETIEMVRRALSSLPETQAELLDQWVEAGADPELAARLGVPRQTIFDRRHRAMARLADALPKRAA